MSTETIIVTASVMLSCLAIAGYYSPNFLQYIAAYLWARSEAIKAHRQKHKEVMARVLEEDELERVIRK